MQKAFKAFKVYGTSSTGGHIIYYIPATDRVVTLEGTYL